MSRQPCHPIRWRGRSYASTGWALPDVYAMHPDATDFEVGVLLGVSQQTVSSHRRRVGIPKLVDRSPTNCYLRRDA
jgi:hypothetical protein